MNCGPRLSLCCRPRSPGKKAADDRHTLKGILRCSRPPPGDVTCRGSTAARAGVDMAHPQFCRRVEKWVVPPDSVFENGLSVSLSQQAIAGKEDTAMKAIDVVAWLTRVCLSVRKNRINTLEKPGSAPWHI